MEEDLYLYPFIYIDEDEEYGYPFSADLERIYNNLDNLEDQLLCFNDEIIPELERHTEALKTLENEVVDESLASSGELSIAAQFLIDKDLIKAEDSLKDLACRHRAAHTNISKSGKEIDRYLGKNLNGLFKNQKNFEKNKHMRQLACELIADHLESSGYTEAAEILCEEADIDGVLDGIKINKMHIDDLNKLLERRDIKAIIDWQAEYDSGNRKLRSDLDKMQLLKFLQQDEKRAGIQYSRKMASHPDSDPEFGQLLAAMFARGPDEYPGVPTWEILEMRVIMAMSSNRCVLNHILSTGAFGVPNLMKIRALVASRQDFLFSGEELPIDIPLLMPIHSTLTCPILRQQVTPTNPAMRLHCGHVISRDAVTKLSQASRIGRLKCPYCPSESHPQDARELKLL